MESVPSHGMVVGGQVGGGADETHDRGNELRRQAVQYGVAVADRFVGLEELTDHLLRGSDRPDHLTRERIELELHHEHLPRLAEAGLIEFDAERGSYRYLGPAGSVFDPTSGLDPLVSDERRDDRPEKSDLPPVDSTDGSDEAGHRLTLDTVYDLLSVARRRHVLHYLRTNGGATTVGDLAEYIAALECGKAVEAVTSKERKRIYIGLYQLHLPRMAQADVIRYNKDRGHVELAPNASQLVRFLPRRPAAQPPKRHSRTALGLAVLGYVVGVIHLSLFPVPWAGAIAVGGLTLLWYLASGPDDRSRP